VGRTGIDSATRVDETQTGRGRGVSVFVLPDFDLVCGERSVVAIPSAQRLIAFLALHGGRRLRRGYVSGTLWGDVPQHRANASLRSAVWRAPFCGGTPVVEASSSHVWLHPSVGVDLDRAHTLVRSLVDPGDQTCDRGHADGHRLEVRGAVAALSDDVLVGWYDDWAVAERERFRLLRLQALEQLAELLLRDGCHRLAVQVAVAAVAAEPLRESAQRLLVRCHLAEGNLAEAVRQYSSYAARLRRDLGVGPSAAMERLLREATDGFAPSPAGWADVAQGRPV
jgi:DNA-binding SARP family transcriptional activator